MPSIARSANASLLMRTQVTADPSERPSRVIPRRLSRWDRIGIAWKSFLGLRTLPNSAGPVDRAVKAWQWTDHRRQLEWLASRPRLQRTVIVGVVGHRSNDVAKSLTTSLVQVRHDRIVLIAGQTPFPHSADPATPMRTLEEIESGLRQSNASSVERDALFARTLQGALFIPLDRASPPPDADTMRRLLAALASHAGVVIIDGGESPTTYAFATEFCDQIICSTTGTEHTFAAQTIVATWSDEHCDGSEPYATVQVGDRSDSMLELAVMSIAGWADFDAATSVPLGH